MNAGLCANSTYIYGNHAAKHLPSLKDSRCRLSDAVVELVGWDQEVCFDSGLLVVDTQANFVLKNVSRSDELVLLFELPCFSGC